MFSKTLINSLARVSPACFFPRVPSPSLWARTLFIQTAGTPNENALKFLPSMKLLQENETREFLSGREAACSPLAVRLFAVDGVKSIMLGSDFITVEKTNDNVEWALLKPEIFSILTECLTNGTPIIADSELSKDIGFQEEDDEVIAMIKELIFTRIRPAIQDDGGDIEFVRFAEDTGTVFLRLMGACRSCNSSSVTLKNGIESMLKYYIEEVKEVKQVDKVEGQAEQAFTEPEAVEIVPRAREEDTSLPPSL